MTEVRISRRNYLHQLAALSAAPFLSFLNTATPTKMITRSLLSGEELPVIGLGTWQTFDVDSSPDALNPLREVLRTLVENYGRVVDSSPMYGQSEKVVGDLSSETGLNEKLFIATKVWTSGKEAGVRQMTDSFLLLRRKQIDLMQIHNLLDWQTHLKTLRDWKEQGKIRYTGITHYTESAYNQIEQIIKSNPVDFLQINYSILSRKAEERLFPLAQERKIGVLINRPFEEGILFSRIKGKPLPDWASEIDCSSWGQFFLKFIVSHPAVTCVIPGTSKPHHMLDNCKAGFGRLPDDGMRKRMIREVLG
ncbi:MAG: aldo/keto reductase [Cyclobacteriaceae bacterium]|nr:aldo/keto reductase [Cyclobacteriaceae bacterium]